MLEKMFFEGAETAAVLADDQIAVVDFEVKGVEVRIWYGRGKFKLHLRKIPPKCHQ